MSFQPIRELQIKSFGCIQDASFQLTPLHALIGPNDSGKSTALRALHAACDFAAKLNVNDVAGTLPSDPFSTAIRYGDGASYELSWASDFRERVILPGGAVVEGKVSRVTNSAGVLWKPENADLVAIASRLSPATLLRLTADLLRAPAEVIVPPTPVSFFDQYGSGLAAVYQAINSRDVDTFIKLRDQARTFFPSLKTIKVPHASGNTVVLEAELRSGALVPARDLSEGLLYYLAFAALQHVEGSRIFLIEEPENGLHPARIGEIMRILREISKSAQVIIATHSPFVVNELEPHEVTVVTRDEHGSHAKLIKDTPNFKNRSEVYALGELWVSYANGNDEAPLLNGDPRP